MSSGPKSAPMSSQEPVAKFASQLSSYWLLKVGHFKRICSTEMEIVNMANKGFLFLERGLPDASHPHTISRDRQGLFLKCIFLKSKETSGRLTEDSLPTPHSHLLGLIVSCVPCAHISTKDWPMDKVLRTPLQHIGYPIPENQGSLSWQ